MINLEMNMMIYVKLFVMVLIYGCANSYSITRSDGSEWSYDGWDGPENWPGICQTGTRQSPVDIGNPKKQLFCGPLKLIGGYWENTPWNAAWNGHTYVAKIDDEENALLLFGGQLKSVYVFHSLHLHWGSEHTINGKRYTGEVHLVHYNSKYTYENALLQPDGLSVLGIFLQESDDDDEDINNEFSDFVDAVTSVSDEESIGKFKFASLLHKSLEPWVRYDGSLTTPGCTENVKWSVVLEPILIRKGLVDNKIHDINDSYRPVQPLNDRILYIKH